MEAWAVQCMFDKKHGVELAQLTMTQIVTVQGECGSYFITDVKLKNCILID